MTRPILIKGGRVIDPSRRTDGVADVYLAEVPGYRHRLRRRRFELRRYGSTIRR